MIKKYSKIFISILALIPFLNVSAQSQSFYVNSNNISMTEEQYSVIQQCWEQEPNDRLTIKEVITQLEKLI